MFSPHHPPVEVELSVGQRAEHQRPGRVGPGHLPAHSSPAPRVLDHEAVLLTPWAVLQVHLRDLDADPGVRGHGV